MMPDSNYNTFCSLTQDAYQRGSLYHNMSSELGSPLNTDSTLMKDFLSKTLVYDLAVVFAGKHLNPSAGKETQRTRSYAQ